MAVLRLVEQVEQVQPLAFLAVLLLMPVVAVAALTLEAQAARVVPVAAERVLIQVLLELTEPQILVVAVAQGRNIAAA